MEVVVDHAGRRYDVTGVPPRGSMTVYPREDPIAGYGRTVLAVAAREMQTIFAHMNMMIAPACAGQTRPDKPRLQRLCYSSRTRDLMFAVAPAGPATAQCPVFYEFSVRLTDVFPGNAGVLPAAAFKQAVFRSDQSADLNPAGKNRLVFRILRSQAQTGESDFLPQNVARYSTAQWRARAINANGMTSDWTDWETGASPVSFGEP